MAIWSRVQTFIFGGAVATAAADGVRPVLEPVKQHAWSRNRQRALDVGTTAQLVAQAIIDASEADDEAARNGYNGNRLAALVKLAQTMPGQSELDKMLNRQKISRPLFNEALAKHSVDPRFWEALYDLTHEKLDPVQLANAIHRGLVPDPGLLAVPPPTGTGNVPAYPTYDIDAIAEAEASGIDRDRLGTLVGLTGLPMGPHEAAQAVFRHILTEVDFQRAVAESNTRNEWGDAIKEQSRQIPTARDFLENALRGYHSLAEAIKGAALHGMSAEHATLIYQNQGRPMNVRQITQALARGGTFHPEPGEITDPYDASIVEGNLKPAYYDFAKALRYTLPSVFAIRGLATSGVWDYEKTRERLLWWGWIPEDADDVAKAWTGGTGPKADPVVKSEQTRLRTATHRSYIAQESDDATASAALAAAGVDPTVIGEVLTLWQHERDLIRAQLSPTDVRKAFQQGDVNAATNVAWTRDEAFTALLDRGWSAIDANDYLNIPYKG